VDKDDVYPGRSLTLTRPRQVAISVDRMAAGANLVPAGSGGEQGATRGLPWPFLCRRQIATTGLAEKTQIPIVQLLTISRRAIAYPKEQTKEPHSGRWGDISSGGSRNVSSS